MSKIRQTSLLLLLSLCMAPLFATISAGQAKAFLIFVTNEKDDTVSVLDGESLKLVKTIPVGHRPRGIIITPDKKDIIVCLGDDAQLAVIDANSLKITRLLESGPDPELLNISPDGKTLYVANEDDSLVTIMDYKTGERTQQAPHGV